MSFLNSSLSYWKLVPWCFEFWSLPFPPFVCQSLTWRWSPCHCEDSSPTDTYTLRLSPSSRACRWRGSQVHLYCQMFGDTESNDTDVARPAVGSSQTAAGKTENSQKML